MATFLLMMTFFCSYCCDYGLSFILMYDSSSSSVTKRLGVEPGGLPSHFGLGGV